MKNIFTTIVSVVILIFISSLDVQSQIPDHYIQTSSGNNVFPLSTTGNNKCQFLFHASELSGTLYPGNITKIYLGPAANTSSATFNGFTVKMTLTNLTTLGTSTQPFITGLQTVVPSSTKTFTGVIADNWVEIPLDTVLYYDGTSNILVEVSQTSYTSGINLRVNTGIAGRRLYGPVGATSGTANSGRVDFGMDLSPTGNNDAGVSALVAPVNFCPGTENIKVKVKNYGQNIIDSLKIGWSLDGVVQPTYSFTGPLDIISGTGTYEQEVTLGSHTFTSAPVDLKAWTTMPNGVLDSMNFNDTLTAILEASVFTIATTNDTICEASDVTMHLTPGSGYQTGDITWQSSTDGITWTDIPNSDTTSYSETNLMNPKWFRAKIGSTNFCYTNELKILVTSVGVLSATGDERCGPGTLSLEATGNTGSTLNWYASETSPTSLGTGSPFITPSISQTDTFYVTSSVGGGGGVANSLTAQTTGGNSCGGGVMFNITPTIDLNIDSFKSHAASSGSIVNVYYRTGTYVGNGTSSAGWTLHESINMAYTVGDIDINLSTPIPLTANTVTGIYLFFYSTYTTGTSPGQSFSNADMTLDAGYGLCSEFGGLNDPRIFNGTVYYSQSGCESPRTPVIAKVNPLPEIGFPDDTTVCSNDTLVLDAGNPGSTYLWSDNTTSQIKNITTTGIYSVTVTDSINCSNSDTIEVTQGLSPTNNLQPITNLCDGDTISLDAGNTGSTFVWSDASTTQTIDVSSGGTYDVLITSPDNCDLLSTTDVIIRPLPVVSLGNDTAICENAQITLNAGNPGMNYIWNTGDTTQTLDVNDPDDYSVIVTSQYNCVDSAEITVTTLPVPTIQGFNFVSLHYETPGKVKFEPINPENVLSYDWDFGDGSPHVTIPEPTHTYSSNGVYTVTLKVLNDCGENEESLTINVDVIVGISKVENTQLDLTVYPNPSRNEFSVEVNNDNIYMTEIKMVNVLGKVVLVKKVNDLRLGKINVAALSSGIYTVLINTDKGTVIKKVQVLK